MRRKYVLAGTNSPGLSDSDGLCRPHPPLRRSPFPKGKVGNSFLGVYVQPTAQFRYTFRVDMGVGSTGVISQVQHIPLFEIEEGGKHPNAEENPSAAVYGLPGA